MGIEVYIRDAFSQFIVSSKFENFSDSLIHQVKRCLLDYIGMAIGGGNIGLSPIVAGLIYEQGGREESTIIGDGRKVPAMNAALVNGVRGHALDMDDGHRYANAHPGVAILPAALALAERENKTGEQLIESIVVGYEVFIRIAKAINPSHLLRGFHTTGSVGPIGAAAACSKLLNLDLEQTANALSIAALQSAGLLEVTTSGEMIKPLHPGKGSQSGVLAALLAKEGAVGPDAIFEGSKGFFKAYSELTDRGNIIEGLGDCYEIMNVYFKFHAACRHVHASLDSVKKIMSQNIFSISEIDKIDIHTYQVAINLTGKNSTSTTGIGAKFNLPVAVGLMLVFGRSDMDIYTDENVNDDLVKKLANMVTIHLDQGMENEYPTKRRGRVLIEAKGHKFFHETEFAKGEPENPASDEDIKRKFISSISRILNKEQASSLFEKIFILEKIEVRKLMEICF